MPNILSPGGATGSYLSGVPDAAQARKIRYGGATEDYAVYNTAKQAYESAKSGTPWHGKVVGGYAVHGKFSSTPSADMPAEAGSSPVQFTVTKTVKQPEVATATGNLLKNQQQVASQTATGFQDFLNQAREVNAQNKTQLGKDQAAFDTTKIEGQLPAINSDYRNAQNDITGSIVDRNKTYADQTQGVLDRLTAANKTYEANAQAVADRAFAAATKRNSLYQLTSGTPTSGSGNMSNRAIRAYSDINIPLQRELADRNYSQIANIERPYQRELYGNDMGVFNRESALASDFAGRDEGTAKYLQTLKMQVAGMSRQQALSYLTGLGLPLELGQRLIAGDVANLGGIQRLDDAANFYTAQTPFDASRLPSIQSFPVSYPGRSYSPSVPSYPVAGVPAAAGPARANPLAPDYSSWNTAPMLAARTADAARRAIPVAAPAYTPDGYSGYPVGSSYLPSSGASVIAGGIPGDQYDFRYH